MQVVAEAIRLLLIAISLVSSVQKNELEQRLMAVLLSVLITDIAPSVSASPALAEVAVKLVTQIASGPSAAAFKAVVTSLPPQDKLRLQVQKRNGCYATLTATEWIEYVLIDSWSPPFSHTNIFVILQFGSQVCLQFALDKMCVCVGCNASCDTACVQVKSVHLTTAKVQNSHHYTEELCCFQPKLSFSRFYLDMDLYPEDGDSVPSFVLP